MNFSKINSYSIQEEILLEIYFILIYINTFIVIENIFQYATSRQDHTASEEDKRKEYEALVERCGRGKQNYWEKNLPTATLSTTNPSVLGSSGFLCDRPANDSLSHGMAASTYSAHGWRVGCLGLLVPAGRVQLKCDLHGDARRGSDRETGECSG